MKYNLTKNSSYEVISISGDVQNDSDVSELITEINEFCKNGNPSICFNLEEATYLNSSGVSVFIHALAATQNKGSVAIVVKDPHVKSVVELSGLDKLMKVYSSMEEFEAAHEIK